MDMEAYRASLRAGAIDGGILGQEDEASVGTWVGELYGIEGMM